MEVIICDEVFLKGLSLFSRQGARCPPCVTSYSWRLPSAVSLMDGVEQAADSSIFQMCAQSQPALCFVGKMAASRFWRTPSKGAGLFTPGASPRCPFSLVCFIDSNWFAVSSGMSELGFW
jgi:hypothetical protein